MGIHLRTTGCTSLAIWDHTCHPTQANSPRLITPAGEGWYSIYRPRRDGRLSWPRCLITRGRGIEPETAGSEVRCPNHCATKTPEESTWPMTSRGSIQDIRFMNGRSIINCIIIYLTLFLRYSDLLVKTSRYFCTLVYSFLVWGR